LDLNGVHRIAVGQSVEGRVRLAKKAPNGGAGVAIDLQSSDPYVLAGPESSVTVSPGEQFARFHLDAKEPSDRPVTVTATCGESSKSVQVRAEPPATIQFTGGKHFAGDQVEGTVTLLGKAARGGVDIAVESSDATVASVSPKPVHIKGGSRSGQFIVQTTTMCPASVTIYTTIWNQQVESYLNVDQRPQRP
jgi:hypothetical protein